MKQRIPTLEEYVQLNESVEQLQKIADNFGDGKIDKSKPSIFQYTIYRLPTKDEIKEFENYPKLTADKILDGFYYTMVGRGILSDESKKRIINGIQLLVDAYPNESKYTDALKQAIELKSRFTK